MSAPALPAELSPALPAKPARTAIDSPLDVLEVVMRGVASLKLTVVLFALAIWVVLIGTLAQTEVDIWQVVRDYFHAWVMWVDINLLFPKSFFPDMPRLDFPLFPSPGGKTIGVLMGLNLLAAHGWRFKIQASGGRLWAGLLVIVTGIILTSLVIVSGHNDGGFQTKPPFSFPQLWIALQWGGVLGLAAGAFSLIQYGIRPAMEKAELTWMRMIVLSIAATALAAIGVLLVLSVTRGWYPGDEALRVLWQMVQGGLSGLVLLAGCVLVFRKRGGMVLLHAGIGLLMVNELLVARQAVEWQIFLHEGETTNYMRDIRTVELAIIDPAAEKTDEHTVIPRDMLEDSWRRTLAAAKLDKPSVSITHELLPFDVAVLEFPKNSDVRPLKAGEKSRATKGRGLKEALTELPAAKGTDTGGGVDFAGAYVKLTAKDGSDLGTYLLSQLASEQTNPERFAEKVTVGGTEYSLFLRFKREYLPFTVRLKDVRKDDYVASNTPRNYSSDVHIVDAAAGVDQPVHIKMNDPLRYRALTFYQSSYNVTPRGEATTLQVVRNRIWMIPYVACGIVGIGMLAHFLITVTRFITRRENEDLAAGDLILVETVDDASPGEARRVKKGAPAKSAARGLDWSLIGLPALAVGIFVAMLLSSLRPARFEPTEMDLARFGRLPVADQGRVKPLDSLARNTLQAISNREYAKFETVTTDGHGKERTEVEKLSAVEWLLEVIAGTEKSQDLRVVRIDHPELLKVFELKPRPGSFRYSVAELRPHIDRFITQAAAASKLPTESLTLDQRKVLELDSRLKKYIGLVESFSQPRLPALPTQAEFEQDPEAARRRIDEFRFAVFESSERLKQLNAPRPIPLDMPEGTADAEHWHAYPAAYTMAFMQTNVMGQEADPMTLGFNEMLTAYKDGDAAAFNRELAGYEAQLARRKPPLWNRADVQREATFNRAAPFALGGGLYVMGFLMALTGWLFRYRPLNWAAFTLIALTFLLHTGALWVRMEISGRPPITNLYSSAVAIGWACALFGLVIELIYRLGLGNVLSAVAGFVTILIAALLASSGDDTVGVMQAVLDTQFWLATHVVCISLGYAATFVAGLIGLLYIILSICTPNMNERSAKDLGRMIYGVVCFAIFFSFVGTVLGGLWADDSWGRFWGWDPKENGALMIVLWNALVLHARWDKMVGDRGLAVLALGGNIITAWSWFGVNQLGIGLHSYGFTSGVVRALMTFGIYMLVCSLFGVLPLRWWWSRAKPGDDRMLQQSVGMVFLAVNLLFLGIFSFYTYQALI